MNLVRGKQSERLEASQSGKDNIMNPNLNKAEEPVGRRPLKEFGTR